MLVNSTNVEIYETDNLESVISEIDILYMTRIQKERFFNEAVYLSLIDSYILTRNKLENAKSNMIVMHPLPRVNEISYDLDEDDRAVYFKQAKFGIYARMALIALQLGVI